jgi:hypothetical protein
MTIKAIIDRWHREGKTASITICDGFISGLVFAKSGEMYAVNRAADFADLITQMDNLLNDRVYKECRLMPAGIE